MVQVHRNLAVPSSRGLAKSLVLTKFALVGMSVASILTYFVVNKLSYFVGSKLVRAELTTGLYHKVA